MSTPPDGQRYDGRADQPTTPPGPPAPRRRRGVGVVGIVLASVLCGGAAGYGGAALRDTKHPAPRPADTGTTDTGTASETTDATPTAAAVRGVEEVAADALPSVVKIDVRGPEGMGSGSGIVLSEDGRILTNHHVVEVAAEQGAIRVSFNDGSTTEATVLGSDPLTDTAVLQAKGVSGLDPATIGDSDDLQVGQQVVAVGSPFGLESTVTTGIVSALDRPVNVATQPDGQSTTYPAIQTDAAINPGNSGGPLVNTAGEVVGINSSIRTAAQGSPFGQSTGGSIGLGFAIPISEVMPIVEQISNGEAPTHARLGVSVSDPRDPTVDGALTREVADGTAAEQAGLRPGDVITAVDGEPVTSADSLVAAIRSYRPEDTVTLTWQRDGEEQSTELQLGSDADQ